VIYRILGNWHLRADAKGIDFPSLFLFVGVRKPQNWPIPKSLTVKTLSVCMPFLNFHKVNKNTKLKGVNNIGSIISLVLTKGMQK